MQSRKLKKRAFSLLELLVVIAIIAILVALSLAGFAKGKGKAQQTQCINNLRQLGIGLCQFTADFHVYPLAVTPHTLWEAYPDHSTSWHTALDKAEFSGKSPMRPDFSTYFNQGVWICPAANVRPADYPAELWSAQYGYNAYGVDARTNEELHGLGGQRRRSDPKLWADTTPPVRDADVLSPSQMLAIGDGFTGNNGVIKDAVWTMDRELSTTNFLGSTERAMSRHHGHADTEYCDGHVDSPSLSLLFDDTGDGALSLWNSDHRPHREVLGL